MEGEREWERRVSIKGDQSSTRITRMHPNYNQFFSSSSSSSSTSTTTTSSTSNVYHILDDDGDDGDGCQLFTLQGGEENFRLWMVIYCKMLVSMNDEEKWNVTGKLSQEILGR